MASGELPAPRPAPSPVPAAPALVVEPAGRQRITSVSIVVPARNEALNLPGLLAEIRAELERAELEFAEVLVIDDGSTDDTPRIATATGARAITHAHSLGNGAAVKRGIREARGEWILLLDGDGQHPPQELSAMLELAERHDMVVASRGGRGGSAHRNIANRIYSRFASYVSGRHIPDLTSGFRLVRASIAKDLVWVLPNTFSYPTTITMSMLRSGFSVAFHPFAVRQRRGKSHIRLFADGSRFFLIILRIATMFAPLRVFLPISLLFAAAGVGWYAFTWFTTGRFTNMAVTLLGQATLLFALGLIAEQIAALRFQNLSRDGR
ncbi:MAG: glycosyltransferase family 2 protein [Planctomycetes bacterium]|nr:glycosyltransferase family 2 protein [Planctomycetota bacterium]